MANLRSPIGHFKPVGSTFVREDGLTFVFRSKPAETQRPSNYLLLVNPDGKRQYWSGLFPESTPNVFRADNSGLKYLVKFDPDGMTVTKSQAYPTDFVSLSENIQ